MPTEEEKLLALKRDNLRKAMKQPAIRDFVWDILELTGLNATSFTSVPGGTEYNEGRRSIGLDILVMLQDTDPGIYPKLILEKQQGGSNA